MTSLALFHPDGEVIEAVDAATLLYAAGIPCVQDADLEQLADVTDKLRELKALAAEATGVLGDAIVHKLDAGARWTVHLDGYTVTAPSPTAGTVTWDVEALRAALDGLIEAGVISPAAGFAAVARIEPMASVSYGFLRDVLAALEGEGDQPDVEGVCGLVMDLLAFEPEPSLKLRPQGVAALLKVLGAREAVEACQVTVDPGRRRAKVTRT